MRTDEASPLSDDERALLDALLEHDFPGVREIREQAKHVAAKRRCECGTIDLVPDGTPVPRSAAANPVPAIGLVTSPDGVEAGGLIRFVRDGMLQSLEVYLPLPRLERVTWQV